MGHEAALHVDLLPHVAERSRHEALVETVDGLPHRAIRDRRRLKQIRVEPSGFQPGWAEPPVDTDALRRDQVLEIHFFDRGIPGSCRRGGSATEEPFSE